MHLVEAVDVPVRVRGAVGVDHAVHRSQGCKERVDDGIDVSGVPHLLLLGELDVLWTADSDFAHGVGGLEDYSPEHHSAEESDNRCYWRVHWKSSEDNGLVPVNIDSKLHFGNPMRSVYKVVEQVFPINV